MPAGSCLCGNVKYEYDQAAMKALCHCLTCRKLSGSCFATTILVPDAQFHMTPSSSKGLKVDETMHETGMAIQYSSCAQCGTAIFKTAAGWPETKIVFWGTLDQDGAGKTGETMNGSTEVSGKAGSEDTISNGAPQAELWIKYRVPWLQALGGGVHQFEEFPPAS